MGNDTFTTYAGQWLNPRRRLHCQRVLHYLMWHGMKVHLNDEHFARMRDEQRLEPYQAESAVNDLFTLGLVDVHLAGETTVVTALVGNADAVEVRFPHIDYADRDAHDGPDDRDVPTFPAPGKSTPKPKRSTAALANPAWRKHV